MIFYELFKISVHTDIKDAKGYRNSSKIWLNLSVLYKYSEQKQNNRNNMNTILQNFLIYSNLILIRNLHH